MPVCFPPKSLTRSVRIGLVCGMIIRTVGPVDAWILPLFVTKSVFPLSLKLGAGVCRANHLGFRCRTWAQPRPAGCRLRVPDAGMNTRLAKGSLLRGHCGSIGRNLWSSPGPEVSRAPEHGGSLRSCALYLRHFECSPRLETKDQAGSSSQDHAVLDRQYVATGSLTDPGRPRRAL